MLWKQKLIEDNCIPEPNSGCWIWEGWVTGKGYGQISIDKKYIGAHRLSWEAFFGEISGKQLVCHKCDVKLCVNPEHLFLGTHADNSNDMHAKGRARPPSGVSHYRAKFSAEDIKKIRSDTRPLSVIGAEYGSSRQYIWKIKKRWLWKDT